MAEAVDRAWDFPSGCFRCRGPASENAKIESGATTPHRSADHAAADAESRKSSANFVISFINWLQDAPSEAISCGFAGSEPSINERTWALEAVPIDP